MGVPMHSEGFHKFRWFGDERVLFQSSGGMALERHFLNFIPASAKLLLEINGLLGS